MLESIKSKGVFRFRSPSEERSVRNNVIYYAVGLLFCVGLLLHRFLGPDVNVNVDVNAGAAVATVVTASETTGRNSGKLFLERKEVTGSRDPTGAGAADRASGPVGLAADGIDDTVTAVVECSTTKGGVTIDVRANWSPIGAAQFLKLVDIGHFTDLPFTRVAPRYITQYGRKYIPPDAPEKGYLKRGGIELLKDDLTLWGKRDMDFGYIFYAGSGKNSRYDEMVTALCPKKGCIQTGLGKAFWETPVGTTRIEGHDVLREIMASGKPYPRLEMAGQHPDAGGPNPGKVLSDAGYLQREYPFLEYWRSCRVTERGIQIARPLYLDYPKSNPNPNPATATAAAAAFLSKAAAAVSDSESESDSNSKNNNKASLIEIEVPTEPFRVEIRLLLDRSDTSSTATITLEVLPQWAPLGAAQFKKLIVNNFYDNTRVFRVVPKFMSQFGISGTPGGRAAWKTPIKDDLQQVEVTQGNIRGSITFAMSGKGSRTTQLFINSVNNNFLDKQGFTPFGRVIDGMQHWDAVNREYGEKPNQGMGQQKGNKYFDEKFPRLTKIESIKLV